MISISKSIIYLIYFSAYSAILLIIGKDSFRHSNTVSKFFVGEKNMNVPRLFFTFAGTWISAATILGIPGTIYQSGFSTLYISVIPWFIGAIMLYIICKRLKEYDVITIPEIFRLRYNSRGLQICFAVIMIVCYIFYLVIQIKGFGIVASALFNVDYRISIFLIYLFILYSTFGGYHTVTKTDALNLILLSLSIVILFVVIFSNISVMDNTHVVLDMTSDVFNRNSTSYLIYLSSFFGWGLGLAANPQYAVRIIAARDYKCAKKMIVVSLFYLAIFYVFLIAIGLGIKILFPDISPLLSTDYIFIHVIDTLINSKWNGFFLISIIGACCSTANSQLLLIASSFSYDIVNVIKNDKLSENQILALSRLGIFLGGTAALFIALDPPGSSLSYGSYIWGIFSTTFFPGLYGTLYMKKITKEGIFASIVFGLLANLFFYSAKTLLHPSFPSVIVSCVCLVVVSRLTWKSDNAQGGEDIA